LSSPRLNAESSEIQALGLKLNAQNSMLKAQPKKWIGATQAYSLQSLSSA